MKEEMLADVVVYKKDDSFIGKLIKQSAWVFMSLPFVVYIIMFRYVPIGGWIMALQNYWPGKSIFQQQWVGFDNFKMLLKTLFFSGIA